MASKEQKAENSFSSNSPAQGAKQKSSSPSSIQPESMKQELQGIEQAAKKDAQEVRSKTKEAMSNRWIRLLARYGYAMKGVVYIVIGILAIQISFGIPTKTPGQKGALEAISNLPLGRVLIIIITIGLIGFALWILIQAIFDTEDKGHNVVGLVVRFGYIVISVFYFSLAYGALRLVVNTKAIEITTTVETRDWTALLLRAPFGVALVILFGLIMLGIGVYLFFKAYAAFYKSKFNLSELDEKWRKGIIIMGRIGYAALGVVFVTIAFFLMVAAIQHKPSDAVGLDGALLELVRQPFGPFLIDIVAVGFIAYGAFSMLEARYRRVRVSKQRKN